MGSWAWVEEDRSGAAQGLILLGLIRAHIRKVRQLGELFYFLFISVTSAIGECCAMGVSGQGRVGVLHAVVEGGVTYSGTQGNPSLC